MKHTIRFFVLAVCCFLSLASSGSDRWMRWRGLDNARDLGGLQTTGSRFVRTNRIYRCQSFNDAAISDELTASRLKSGLVGATLPLIYGRANSDEIVVLINRDDLTAGCQAVANRLSADQSLWRAGAPRGTAESRAAILAATGLKTEIDLRNDSECYGMTGSPLGESVNWVHLPAGQTLGWYVTAEGKAFFKACFPYFLNEANYPIAIHGLCGAERTGRLAFVLGALLDVKEAQLTDDYALTSVTSGGSCSASTIRAEESAFASYSGSTLNERIAAYALDCGFSAEDLETYRALALEPEEEAGEEGGEGEDEDPTAGLPEDVERLEYIQSVGDAYIDTGVKINSETDEVEIDFEMTDYSTTTANGIFGSRIASDNENYTLQFTSNANILFGCRANNSDTSHQLRLTDAAVKTRYIFRASQSSRSLTDAATSQVLASDTSSLVPFSSTENAYLFWSNVETSWQKAKMKLYRCRIWREGELLRDFVPCRALVDGVETVCLYDKESRGFFGAEDGGSFMAPPAPPKPHGKIRIVQICDPQFGFVTGMIPDRTAANHEKYYAEDLAAFKRMIPYVNAENADLIVIAGDLVQYSDELTRDWPDLLAQFTAPVLIVPGNHDLGAWNQAKTQFDANTAYEQSYKDFVSFVGYGYGSRVIGNWRIVGMNSQFWQALDGSAYMSEQKDAHLAWYNAEIAAAKANGQGLVVVSHTAPFVDSLNEANSLFNLPKPDRTTLLDQVVDAGGTAWLAGHSHLHRNNTYGDLNIYIGEAMCANYSAGGWPRGYTVFEVAENSTDATWRDVTESEWREVSDDLLLHYRADTGVMTDESGKVIGWKNLGALGTAGDATLVVDKDNAACASDMTLNATGANGRPSVSFGGTSCLMTAGDIDLGATKSGGSCWFVAFKSEIPYSGSENRCLMGLADKVSTGYRFGAFHSSGDGTTENVRVFAMHNGGTDKVTCPDDWFVLSHSAWGSSCVAYNGAYVSFANRGPTVTAVGQFSIGKLGALTWPTFQGEIAEIRCYSRSLTPSERAAVQMEMGINAGVANMDFGGLDLFSADGKAYTEDFTGFGFRPNIGAGSMKSAQSGELMVDYAVAPATTENTLACLAHTAAEGFDRTWCLVADQSTGATGHQHALRLTYNGAKDCDTYEFYYRASTTSEWTLLDTVEGGQSDTAPSIVLPAGWQDGYYRIVGCYEQPPEPPAPGIQVGDNLTATFKNGVCTISGTGAMWDGDALAELRALAITNLVIGEGITSISASAFEKMRSIHNVTIGSTVTNIGQQVFHKCYNLTNIVILTGATAPTVGEYAFFRCNSLVRITVMGDSSVNWGDKAFTLQAGIRINSDTGLPDIYPIPEIVDENGYVTVLYGTNDLNGDWTKITSDADRKNYHFFKIVIEEK